MEEALDTGTRTVDSITRPEIEDFLYEEADLLDQWRLDEWAELFTEDSRYVVPSNDHPEADPKTDLVLIDDDNFRLRERVKRLNSRRAHREYPYSHTRHLVTNVRITGREGENVFVSAAFVVHRFRHERADYYVGRYEYALALVEDRLKIRRKRAIMDMDVLRPAGAVSVLL